MTDERYVFQQDVKERSKIKSGALHKKNGSKNKRCTLPSDRLTPAQKKKLNGECMTINLNQQITAIKELNQYPVSMQTEYLQNLISKYGGRRKDICTMLRTDNASFNKYCDRHGIILNFPFTGRGKASKMDDRWLEFITRPEDETVTQKDIEVIKEHYQEKTEPVAEVTPIEVTPIPAPEPIKVIKVSEQKPVTKVSGYSSVIKMQLNLKGSKAEIMHMMDAILGDECIYAVDLRIANTNREELA